MLNPELRRDATPPDDPEYRLKVPVGTREKVEQLLERAPTHKFPPLPMPVQVKNRHFKNEPDSGHWYRVPSATLWRRSPNASTSPSRPSSPTTT